MATEGAIEICSCDEALALRARVGELEAKLGARKLYTSEQVQARVAAEARISRAIAILSEPGVADETLTDDELTDEALGIVDGQVLIKPWAGLGFACPHCGQTALHEATQALIDALTERIERARKILAEARPVDSAEARLASDLREVLG